MAPVSPLAPEAPLSQPTFTRGDFVVRGAVALASVSAIGRLLAGAPPAAAAGMSDSGTCAVGAFLDPRVTRALQSAGIDPAARFASLLARPLRLTSTFVAWDEQFPNAGHRADRAAGRSSLICWDGRRDLDAIASGRWDGLLLERARECRAFSAPLYVRWAAEFNGPWNPVYGQTSAFVRAWRHMVNLFRDAGATNVKWVFCPYASVDRTVKAQDWRAYYPGDDHVDWVGMDGYNWGAARPWSRWQSFSEIFTPLYSDFAGKKPVMICEVASAEAGGDKARWISDMATQLRGPFSGVRAFAWFDIDKETDWRVNSSPAALTAFKALVHEPRYA